MGGFGNISWFENFIKENLVNIMRRGKREKGGRILLILREISRKKGLENFINFVKSKLNEILSSNMKNVRFLVIKFPRFYVILIFF